MLSRYPYLLLIYLLLSFTGCQSQQRSTPEAGNNASTDSTRTDDPYIYKSGDPNGIGKWYMGRQIAHVMGYQGINWLERPEREKEEQTSKLLKNMNIQPGDTIADIGAGSGYHVFKMSPKLRSGEALKDNGQVYAVDIQEEMLQAMRKKKKELGIANVTLIKGTEKSVQLPANTIDKVLLVDVYHEFSFPKEIMQSIYTALRPDGEVYLIEYRKEDAGIPIKTIHKMSEAQAVKELTAAGFTLKENIGNLPWQHCMVFVKEENYN
ncbi:class I SAM-dependent methyltransferase [Gangjinia marincola]|uniref:Class I SAM-dependent methyltransferase n=1 Tax=Gangjinia marincola TaxID=578463 RepID=A0ABN1MDF8_9FLAO